ncbi:hypothetical protein, partial [Pontibacterium sp.]|uniref:hypothetical protein n=1 Tax=Pontibacterium sp. TaxID=2036026 RepID=UPI00356AE486
FVGPRNKLPKRLINKFVLTHFKDRLNQIIKGKQSRHHYQKAIKLRNTRHPGAYASDYATRRVLGIVPAVPKGSSEK